MPLGMEVDLGAGHIVLDGSQRSAEGAAAPPLLGPCLLWPRSPISATAELLYIDILVWQYLAPQQIYLCSKVISEQNQLND